MPGIDMADPERTETKSGLTGSPNFLRDATSTCLICSRTSSIKPAGNSLLGVSKKVKHASVEITKPGGTFRPI